MNTTNPIEQLRFKFTLNAIEQMRATIGSAPPEMGGLLGGDLETYTVTHFHLDGNARCSSATYSPDCGTINRLLSEEWNPRGIRMLGFAHSHPGGLEPSAGDKEYASAILAANKETPCLLLPIILPAINGGIFQCRLFVASRSSGSIQIQREPLIIVDDPDPIPASLQEDTTTAALQTEAELSDEYVEQAIFTRIRTSVSLERLRQSRIIWVGLGGARGLAEDLARTGVRQHILIDHDTVSHPNVATQGASTDEVGRPKVICVAESIRRLNPMAMALPIQKRLEQIDDAEFHRLVFNPHPEEALDGSVPKQTIVVGCTDNFGAQTRINRLGLQFGIPTLCAQIYARGVGGEITFAVPGVTPACHRCILSARYKAHLREQFQPITSEGTVPFVTPWVNAASAFVILAILHAAPRAQSTAIPKRWRNVLERIAHRNLVQLRFDPDLESEIGLKNFEEALSGANSGQLFCGDMIWRPQTPENPENGYPPCPDCGGTGDLRTSVGRFPDTREVIV